MLAAAPYVTSDLPGIGGRLRARPEDFQVEELPETAPGREGAWSWLMVEKTGLPSLEVLSRLSALLGVSASEFRLGGLKDAQAVTRQWFTLPYRPEHEALEGRRLRGFSILAVRRHTEPLHKGGIRGNRFRIIIREVDPDVLLPAQRVLDVLQHRGLPAFYGRQRFGQRLNSHWVGRALLAGDLRACLDEIIGRSHSSESPQVQEARAAYRRGDLKEALAGMPGILHLERSLLRTMLEGHENPQRLLRRIPARLRTLMINALQAALFNSVLARRLDDYDRILSGDIAYRHATGALEAVGDQAAATAAAQAFELSATGPLPGAATSLGVHQGTHPAPHGQTARLEAEELERWGLTSERFAGRQGAPGARRPLRFPLRGLRLSRRNEGLLLEVTLPPGAYVTVLTGELMKTAPPPVFDPQPPTLQFQNDAIETVPGF